MNHEKLREILLTKRWKKTTTFKTYPHSYSLEKEWSDKDLYYECWKYINDNGTPRVFYRRIYRYYIIDDYEYWAMGTTESETGIINRIKIEWK